MSEVAVCSDEMLGAFFSPFWRLIKFILSYLILSYLYNESSLKHNHKV